MFGGLYIIITGNIPGHRYNVISMARLDRLYVFNYQVNLARECKISPVGFSDHCSVVYNVFINSVHLKSAYWHLNVSL